MKDPRDIERQNYHRLRDRAVDLRKDLGKVNAALRALQDICEPHDWVYQGHGHNYDAYACTVCGAEDSR